MVVGAECVQVGARVEAWESLEGASFRDLLVAGLVTLTFSGARVETVVGSRSAARDLHQSVLAGQAAWAQRARDAVTGALSVLQAFLGEDRYLSRFHLRTFQEANRHLFGESVAAAARALVSRGDAAASAYLTHAADLEASVDARNARWSQQEQVRWASYFDKVEKSRLTDEQRKAAVDFENRNLLVAAAGSGKSSTLVAKIGYAIERGLFQPEEILALAFNKDAANELRDRIAKQLKAIPGSKRIASKTFHGLGSDIMSTQTKQTLEDERDLRVKEAFSRLHDQDAAFRRDAGSFIVNYTPDLRDRTEFATYEEYREYLATAEAQWGKGANGRKVKTLNGHFVASLEEARIANWLFMNDVPYKYEHTYPHFEATKDRRSYTPDFYYPTIDTWHEHFGVDAQGRPAAFMDQDKYLEGMAWKRELHRTWNTRLIETTSAQVSNASVLQVLERTLRDLGQPIQPLSDEETALRLGKRPHQELAQLVAQFLAHWRSKAIPFDDLRRAGNARDAAFIEIARAVNEAYRDGLRSERKIDFDDMILRPTSMATTGTWKSPYRFILIDEFQDISPARARFVQSLLAQHEDAVLFCVGDDWQSINGFAGSDVSLMRNFGSEFGHHVRNHLTQTFRSNQGISTAAKRFVERNPSQLQKDVRAIDPRKLDCIRVLPYSDPASLTARYAEIGRELAAETAGWKRAPDSDETPPPAPSVMVLGRYRKNKKSGGLEILRHNAPGLAVEFNTIHASKGQEADYVIVDQLEAAGPLAFPSRITEDSVLRLVMPEPEDFPFAEERRLMYVALTRARHRAYLLVRSEGPSSFVRELDPTATSVGTTAGKLKPCPYCKNGILEMKTGKYGPFEGCSRHPNCVGRPPAKKPRVGPRA